MFKRSKSKFIDFSKLADKAVDAYEGLPPVKKRRKMKIFIRTVKYASFVFALFLLLVLGVIGVNYVSLKMIYQEAISGKDNIEYSVLLITEQDYSGAREFATQANYNFADGLELLEEYRRGFFANNIQFIGRQVDNLVYLFRASQTLSEAALEGSDFALSLGVVTGKGQTNFTKLTKDEKKSLLDIIYKSGPELGSIKSNIDSALLDLNKVDLNGLLLPARGKINELNSKLEEANALLAKAIPMSELLPAMLGYPDKSSFLVMLQNSDELRPTGGFLGTYGILESEAGDILRFETHDIYHMDMPVKDKLAIVPPEPLKKYLGIDKWYMRDANWSPDWPETSKKLIEFYNKEDALLPPKDQINNFKGNFDGVIGITPELITDLLKLTGPVEIEGEVYDENNFLQLLEYKVEKDYVQLGVPSWQRKEVIGKIAEELKVRIFDLSPKDFFSAINMVNDNLEKKNILIYFSDQDRQNFALGQGWGGEIKNTAGDYIMVVDANMAAYKTDSVISRKMIYEVDEGVNGVFSDLTLNYSHSGGFDWRTTRYRSYTRVYVPKGSELIESSGYTEGDTQVYDELGKTVFAAFISIEPGEIGSLHFKYKLPKNLNNESVSDAYSLYIQKQPGRKTENLIVDLSPKNKVESYSPTGFYVYADNNRLKWETDFVTDKIFKINY